VESHIRAEAEARRAVDEREVVVARVKAEGNQAAANLAVREAKKLATFEGRRRDDYGG
jgi:hypothetical protein